ncbi:MAG: hypothetical protein E7288_04505 [Lachnospiraceae bacterium]|nr:hypothetical protein [Lachnospiraceae bacterium]
MSVNGITAASEAGYVAYQTGVAKTNEKTTVKKEAQKSEAAAIYEPGAKKEVPGKKVANPELVSYLKSESAARVEQLRQLVSQLICGQGKAIGTADDMWKFLAGGNFTVDPATKAQAQADIAEDGYWGVEATSDRIVDFAVALAGNDPDKLEEMRAAFEKGFKQATETWGGKLPDISQRTYDAVQKKFDKLTGKTSETSETES